MTQKKVVSPLNAVEFATVIRCLTKKEYTIYMALVKRIKAYDEMLKSAEREYLDFLQLGKEQYQKQVDKSMKKWGQPISPKP